MYFKFSNSKKFCIFFVKYIFFINPKSKKNPHIIIKMASSISRRKIRSVAIIGGTHGNERGGVHLARYFDEQQQHYADKWKTLSVKGLVSNIEAVKINQRYVDEDLNRCFTMAKLQEPRDSYEYKRAAELNSMLGPKGNSKVDFIFDLHNSTSNTGMMLCFHHTDNLACEVAGHLNRIDPQVRLVHWPKGDQPFLPTLGRSGVTVELGPVSHGTVHSPSVERVFKLLHHGIDYLDKLNLEDSSTPREDHFVSIGERLASIDFPRDPNTNDAKYFLHTSIQGIPELQDGSYLRPGQPLFQKVDGSIAERFDPVKYGLPATSPDEKYYPVFVNEAAYFEKHTAFFIYHRNDNIKISLLSNSNNEKDLSQKTDKEIIINKSA